MNKPFIPKHSILFTNRNDIGYSETRLGQAAIPVYCIGKNSKFDEIKKLMKLSLPKSSHKLLPEQI